MSDKKGRFALYTIDPDNPSVGRMGPICTGLESMAKDQCSDGQYCVEIPEGITPRTHYINVDTGRANKRPRTPCTPSRTELPADGTTPLTLSQMRPDTVITITGPVSDTFTASGSETLRFQLPGRYRIKAEADFPALPREFFVNAS